MSQPPPDPTKEPYNDAAGQPIGEGDLVAYGIRSGNHGGLLLGTVVKCVTSPRGWHFRVAKATGGITYKPGHQLIVYRRKADA